MRNSWKVARWEIRRNLKNKSFLISLISTPIIFMLFAFVPAFFNKDSNEMVTVHVLDEIGVYDQIVQIATENEANWNVQRTDANETEFPKLVKEHEHTSYIALTQEGLENGTIHVYMSEDINDRFLLETKLLEEPLRQQQLAQLELTDKQIAVVGKGIQMEAVSSGEEAATRLGNTDRMKHLIPGVAAGMVLFSIVMTGMMIFTSASQEKKEKVAEIVLSSVTTTELMQGKIIGYFVLGITQVTVWMLFLIPIVLWKMDFPLLEYLLVPEMLVLLFIALTGYLLFSAIFVSIGATVEDMSSTSNFQGIIMTIPFIPMVFLGPLLSDPNGLIAKVLTFVPITAPSVLIFRLSQLEQWPWLEIVIAIAVLIFSIWLAMKAAGKIFKIGILMYGKNATPKEIWKWMWA
ncbi:ABC transporter permease [Sporosarcina sp. Te-1]|uniref:ABC transporter permease n=1 Tax=Sporosarcina sp. Te-1 TaxID=2818390 RepID=UPI001A9D19C1|nr:ABC transporter permease [Sporosarcina sp. Te-1]QTD40305.1 ABC transporter permease [Sporosarcina sp. Te-1]